MLNSSKLFFLIELTMFIQLFIFSIIYFFIFYFVDTTEQEWASHVML